MLHTAMHVCARRLRIHQEAAVKGGRRNTAIVRSSTMAVKHRRLQCEDESYALLVNAISKLGGKREESCSRSGWPYGTTYVLIGLRASHRFTIGCCGGLALSAVHLQVRRCQAQYRIEAGICPASASCQIPARHLCIPPISFKLSSMPFTSEHMLKAPGSCNSTQSIRFMHAKGVEISAPIQ